nr:hypothetical protein [Tanacetum cinerariifolium]
MIRREWEWEWEPRYFSTWHDPEDSLFGERDHHIIQKIEIIRECMRVRDANMLNKSSEKHPVGKSHIGALGYTNHSIDDVVGKIEVLSNGKIVEHVAETSIGVVLVSHEAYGIFTEDDFSFFKIGFQFGNDHLEGVKGNINSFDLASFTRRSRIKKGITNKKRIFKGGWINVRVKVNTIW